MLFNNLISGQELAQNQKSSLRNAHGKLNISNFRVDKMFVYEYTIYIIYTRTQTFYIIYPLIEKEAKSMNRHNGGFSYLNIFSPMLEFHRVFLNIQIPNRLPNHSFFNSSSSV